MSFNTRLEVDFKREYENVQFLFRQRPGLGGMAALPPSVSQVIGKYLCFLVERGMREVSMPVYDPNRGKLNPKELYAILHVVFAETEIMVHQTSQKLLHITNLLHLMKNYS